MNEITATPATWAAVLRTPRAEPTKILLASGVYPKLLVNGVKNGSTVTVTAEPAAEVVILGLDIRKAKGFLFTGLRFQAKGAGEFFFLVSDSEDVHFNSLKIGGPRATDPASKAAGVSLLRSKSVSITNSEVFDLRVGVGIGNCEGVKVLGNDFHDLRADGVMGAASSKIEITDNSFRQFWPQATDHPDGIQFQTTSADRSSEDILIARNSFERGAGAAFQGIFMRDEKGTLPYRRVKVLDNLLIGTGYRGVSVSHGEDIEIARNELISVDAKQTNSLLIKDIVGGSVLDNTAIGFAFDASQGVTEAGNVVNKPMTAGASTELKSWRAKFRAPAGMPDVPASDGGEEIATLKADLAKAQAALDAEKLASEELRTEIAELMRLSDIQAANYKTLIENVKAAIGLAGA